MSALETRRAGTTREARQCLERRSPYLRDVPPFGVPQIVDAASAAGSVLDAGCGSARLTLALVEAGAADVVGIDTSLERLAQGRARLTAHPMRARVTLMEADFDHALPFSDGRFNAAVSRLALMIAADPVVTLRELRRVTAAGGRIVTALWAPVDENPWFALPRAAAAAALGPDRANYARALGRLGSPEEATEVHRAAGLADVQAETLRQTLDVQDATGLWTWMTGENGHVRRLDATLSVSERAAVLVELDRLVAAYRTRRLARSPAHHDAGDRDRLTHRRGRVASASTKFVIFDSYRVLRFDSMTRHGILVGHDVTGQADG